MDSQSLYFRNLEHTSITGYFCRGKSNVILLLFIWENISEWFTISMRECIIIHMLVQLSLWLWLLCWLVSGVKLFRKHWETTSVIAKTIGLALNESLKDRVILEWQIHLWAWLSSELVMTEDHLSEMNLHPGTKNRMQKRSVAIDAVKQRDAAPQNNSSCHPWRSAGYAWEDKWCSYLAEDSTCLIFFF